MLALTALFFAHVPGMEIEDDESTWCAEGDPTLRIYNAFEERFESATRASHGADPFSYTVPPARTGHRPHEPAK